MTTTQQQATQTQISTGITSSTINSSSLYTTTTTTTWPPKNYNNTYKLNILDENNNIDKSYDIRNILLLFEKMLEKTNMSGLLDLEYEELKKIIDREDKIDNLLNE